jgi:hypothetical protein
MADFDSDPVPEPDVSTVPVGATVIAQDDTILGRVREIHPHYLFVAAADSPNLDLEVPLRAIARFEAGKLYLRVNREALNEVDDAESVRRRQWSE